MPGKVGKPLLFGTVKELQDKIDAYFKSCYDYKRDSHGTRMKGRTCINLEEVADDPNLKKRYKYDKDYLMEQIKPFTVTGLAVALNTSRATLMNYENRDEYFNTIRNAKKIIYEYAESKLYSPYANGAKFALINNHDWKDKKDISMNALVRNSVESMSEEELLLELERLKKD
jgi:hypothetical protein